MFFPWPPALGLREEAAATEEHIESCVCTINKLYAGMLIQYTLVLSTSRKYWRARELILVMSSLENWLVDEIS